ncbi:MULTISPECIES: (2,3-dihydroxybenzoyl)adenylate synthase [Streptomyces]|uniref:(2,3-dihydroxybenzoyl)adenylate synthase n=1 Tax=Streptomyces TaxID=1883 RepID=UPI001B384B6B|nr:AMP-binding protein [Streptomyces sp. RK75]MBQ0867125.1 AMP-binding protein [Streptomyces sp. RK75]
MGQVFWPNSVAADYECRGYWRRQLLGDLPRKWAARHGDRVAVVDDHRSLTYAELAAITERTAARLLRSGLRDGDNLVLQLPNSCEFVALLLGCMRAGIAPVMALPQYREHELVHLVRTTDAAAIAVAGQEWRCDYEQLAHRVAEMSDRRCRVLVAGEPGRPASVSLRPALERRPAAAREEADGTGTPPDLPSPLPDDLALLLLSGGTTSGAPKLIGRTHNDYEYNFRRMAELCGFDERTVYLAVLPAGHNFTLGCPGVLGALSTGGKVVLVSSPAPEAAFAAIDRHAVTATALVPSLAQRWLDSVAGTRYDTCGLALAQVGGARCPESVVTGLQGAFGCTVQQVFGMAEGLLNCTRLDDPAVIVRGTQGRPISPGDEIRIVDAEGRPAERGELLTRGPCTPRGYFRGGTHNSRSFTADGWYRTGDIVRRHPSGNLVVEGRTKDLINRNGEKISAAEVEDLACLIPGVRAAVAVPVPDPATGERLGLGVVLRHGNGLDLDQVRTFLTGKGVARFKLPEYLHVLPEIPLTPLGKPDKKKVRDFLLADRSVETV